jgi:hypothetical protein
MGGEGSHFGFYSAIVAAMESDPPTFSALLGRDPTALEEAMAIFLIRTGRRWYVEQLIRGHRADSADAIRAVYDVADLVVEEWEKLGARHQDALRAELRRLLWRIRGRRVAGTWREAAAAMLAGDEGAIGPPLPGAASPPSPSAGR